MTLEILKTYTQVIIKSLNSEDLNTSIQMLINSSSDNAYPKMLVTATYIEADIKPAPIIVVKGKLVN